MALDAVDKMKSESDMGKTSYGTVREMAGGNVQFQLAWRRYRLLRLLLLSIVDCIEFFVRPQLSALALWLFVQYDERSTH